MLTSKVGYPQGSVFAQRINENPEEKSVVAEYVVERLLDDGAFTFISDGSSTFYVAIALFEKQRRNCQLFTNSVPVIHEYPFWRIPGNWPTGLSFDVTMLEGKTDAELMMVHSDEACDAIEGRLARRIAWNVLSMRSLFKTYGPAGKEGNSINIKKAAINGAIKERQRILFVADHGKFTKAYNDLIPMILYEEDWKNLLDSDLIYIVTTLPPSQHSHEMENEGRRLAGTLNIDPTRLTELELYAWNTWDLRNSLNKHCRPKRFIEIQCPSPPQQAAPVQG